MSAREIRYLHEGWHPHSGAGPKNDKWWVAEYRNGQRTRTVDRADGNLILFATYDGAKVRANELNASAERGESR
ncbi:hypothetical protein [Streptomyces sp. WAC05858]|uniref:hypothetical protein n=1 Tax=Streptomyces TaxID=1883 RepID=UPI000F7B64EF|nr:hypothetical protein [Streptomyces sp. WAC05858]RSS39439.1 hypothetical protein EF902_27515 [Streptomyces sp. WAC05858]